MTVGKWRQQLRLMQAMRLLADGAKVTHAALEAGYSTASAFIAMFGRALGTTPANYFRSTDALAPGAHVPSKKAVPVKHPVQPILTRRQHLK